MVAGRIVRPRLRKTPAVTFECVHYHNEMSRVSLPNPPE